jgi:signal peptidase I
MISPGALVTIKQFGAALWVVRRPASNGSWYCTGKLRDAIGRAAWRGQIAGAGDIIVIRDAPDYLPGEVIERDGLSLTVVADRGDEVEFSVPEFWIEVLGKTIKKVHVKDFKRAHGLHSGGCFVNLLEGDVNWARVVKAFRAAGYDGYLTAELDVIKYRPEYLYGITSGALDIIINL